MSTHTFKSKYANLIERLDAIRTCKLFETLVIAVIVISALAIGANTHDLPPNAIKVLHVLDFSITVFFLFEIIIRMMVEPQFKNFFKNGWNVFDTIIVTVSLIPIDDSETVLLARLLRIFRVLRLISFVPELRMLVGALLKAIPRMGYVVLLMFVIFYMYGAVGSMFFNTVDPELWGNISVAMITMFRVVTFDNWSEVMYAVMDVYSLAWIYFLSFIFLNAFVFLNMMIGVVIDVFSQEHEKHSKEIGKGEAFEVHDTHEVVLALQQQITEMNNTLKQHITDKK
ncbi:ion transporter [Candidatus Woesearchaeota archaeon]|jgi:voltage-gated sodium channel|nr:ion transporter [Candidatus Woesearchaeota archaeon]